MCTRTRTRTRRAHGVCGELAGTYCLVVTRLLRLVRGSRCVECQPAHRCNRRARQVHPFARPDRHLGNSTLDGVRCLEETHDQHVHFVVQLAQTRAHGRNVRLQRAWCGHGSAGTCTRAATSPRQQDARAVSISDNHRQPATTAVVRPRSRARRGPSGIAMVCNGRHPGRATSGHAHAPARLTANICARFETLGNMSLAGNGGRGGASSDLRAVQGSAAGPGHNTHVMSRGLAWQHQAVPSARCHLRGPHALPPTRQVLFATTHSGPEQHDQPRTRSHAM